MHSRDTKTEKQNILTIIYTLFKYYPPGFILLKLGLPVTYGQTEPLWHFQTRFSNQVIKYQCHLESICLPS